jgi:hypothetical protein
MKSLGVSRETVAAEISPGQIFLSFYTFFTPIHCRVVVTQGACSAIFSDPEHALIRRRNTEVNWLIVCVLSSL